MTEVLSWQEFKAVAAELTAKAREERSQLIFRGHGSDQWSLDTTLERSQHDEGVMDYYRLMLRIKSEVQAYTSNKWDDAPEVPELMDDIGGGYDQFSRFMSRGAFPHYPYMTYLRHHGFPSPLLDWSSSPYVAAYFAFAELMSGISNVAIFAFRERGKEGFKVGGSDTPSIRQLGPYVSGPKRHFAQRSQYTICTHWNGGVPMFWAHGDVCKAYDPKAEFQQDIIYKFSLPLSERSEVLRELADYNLTAFSLFGTEESLLRYLSLREEPI